MKAIWPDVIVEENNLNQSISAVRRILGDSRDEHRYIVTIPGVGYQFVSDVKVLSDEASSGNSGVVLRVGVHEAPGAEPERTVGTGDSGSDGGRGRLTLTLVHLRDKPGHRQQPERDHCPARGEMGGRRGRAPGRRRLDVGARSSGGTPDWFAIHPTPASESATDSTAPRLAVLPFANLSPEPANAFFADGLHEEILSTLAERIPGIAVISRTTMMSYRQTPKPLGEVARELGATHVMEGTVRREGDHVRLTLQLVDAGTDRYLWSQTYDRALASAMTLQSEVAADVATQLSVRLAADAEGTKPITRDAEAYDLYLRALVIFRDLDFNDDSQNQALEDVLNRALARDRSFAQAYAQRARLHTVLFSCGMDTSDRNQSSISADLAAAQRTGAERPHHASAHSGTSCWPLASSPARSKPSRQRKRPACAIPNGSFRRLALCWP